MATVNSENARFERRVTPRQEEDAFGLSKPGGSCTEVFVVAMGDVAMTHWSGQYAAVCHDGTVDLCAAMYCMNTA